MRFLTSDAPVLGTDQFFTLSPWALVDNETNNYALISADGRPESAMRALNFTPFTATNPPAVGSTLRHGNHINAFCGGVDDIQVWQAPMTDAQVLERRRGQAP
ncbi:hypothetical protein [Catellatospora paridis]|uniref:hypothetical protein n=1 Tax=Catellatospora paridis TaxID=1617086 RepID=UPI0012D4728B|nr:hypothetical protein [Catellatospora paridis]